MSNLKEEPKTDSNKYTNEINLFYSTKEKYKDAYDNKVDKIMSKKGLDINSKRDKVKEIVMPCIFCKRKVNTIFSRRNHSLSIYCGSKEEPCNMKFELKLAWYSNLIDIIDGLEDRINTIKEKIIRLKTDLLYNYINDESAIEKFEEFSKDLNEFTELYITLMKKKDNLFNNDETQHLILQKKSILEEYMSFNKELIETYKTEEMLETLNNYIENIVQVIEPVHKEIYDLKYAHKEVISVEKRSNKLDNEKQNNDSKEFIHTLFQRNVLFEYLDNLFDENDHQLIQNDLHS